MDNSVVLSEIRQVPTGHQYNNYVGILPSEINWWIKQGKKVFCLTKTSFTQVTERQKVGRYFVLYV